MKQVDEQRLETDVDYRYEFLTEFIGFTADDVTLIHGLAAQLLPRIPVIVDTTYEKLLSYTATARHFLPRQHGFEGPLPAKLDELGLESAQIQFRKEHLQRYLQGLIGNPYDPRMVRYLDVVGKIHTPQAGNKNINVPLVQMNALMGLLAEVLMETIYDLELERGAERKTQRAMSKLLWIQNDFINRHYAGNTQRSPPPEAPPPSAAWK